MGFPWSLNRTSSSQAGFSLIEVLVAMFVISVGIMGVMAALFWGVQHSDSGKIVTEASTIARTIAETVRLQGVKRPFNTWANDPPAARVAVDAVPFNGPNSPYLNVIKGPNTANTQSSLARFQRNISLVELSPPSTTSHLGSLARLSVKIYWREEALSRQVNVETIVPIIEG